MAADRDAWQQRIVRDPEVMAGKPVVRGTRIPVARVVAELGNRPDLTELFAIYPELTIDDVQACLRYAAATLEGVGSRHPGRRSPAVRVSTA